MSGDTAVEQPVVTEEEAKAVASEPAAPVKLEEGGAGAGAGGGPAPPTDDELAARLQTMLPKVDVYTTTAKMIRKMLSEEFKVDLTDRKDFLAGKIQEYLDSMNVGGEAEEEEEGGRERKRKRKSSGGKGGSLGSILSPEIQEFLGVESLPRPQVVKKIWEYIRAHNLQNPKNKREILCDEKLGRILGPKSDIFGMNRALSKHIFTGDVVRREVVDEEEEEEEEKPKKKRAKAKKGEEKAPKGKAAEKTPRSRGKEAPEEADGEGGEAPAPKGKRGGFGGDVLVSAELAEIVGAPQLPRPQVVKKIWEYIRAHELQDPKDKRRILCGKDEKLGKVMGCKTVTMFQMNSKLQRHMKTATEVVGGDEEEDEDESDESGSEEDNE